MARGIYKRGKVYWIRFAGLDGRVLYESTRSSKFKDAQDLLLKRKNEVKQGKQPELKRVVNCTFNQLADKYLTWIEGRQKAAQVKGYIIGQLRASVGNLLLRRFNTLVVEQIQTEHLNRGLQPASINKIINVLKHMFTKAVDWEMVESEVSKRVHKVKLLPGEKKRLRYLSREECQALIASCDRHLRPIVITALNTGMRKGEFLRLKWDNVDLKHGFILLEVTKNGERREIPINETLRSTLLGIQRRLDSPYVFINSETDKPFQNVPRSFRSACKRAGIKDFRIHDMRHTFASHLVMAGVDLTTVKELLGHKTLTMTLRYAHLSPSHKVKAIQTLDESLNGESSIQKVYNQGKSEKGDSRKCLKKLVGATGFEPVTSTV